MARKRHSAAEVINMLDRADVDLANVQSVAVA